MLFFLQSSYYVFGFHFIYYVFSIFFFFFFFLQFNYSVFFFCCCFFFFFFFFFFLVQFVCCFFTAQSSIFSFCLGFYFDCSVIMLFFSLQLLWVFFHLLKRN